MGYQESLIYIQPQEQVGQIVKSILWRGSSRTPAGASWRTFPPRSGCRPAERLPGGFRAALGSGRAQQ